MSQVAADGGCERDVVNRTFEGYRAWGVQKSVLNNRGLVINAKKCLYDGIIAPTALYGGGAWGMRSAERRKVNVLEMKCLVNLVGEPRMDRVRNEEVRLRAGIEMKLSTKADQGVLIVGTLVWIGLGTWREIMSTLWLEGVDGGCKWREGTG